MLWAPMFMNTARYPLIKIIHNWCYDNFDDDLVVDHHHHHYQKVDPSCTKETSNFKQAKCGLQFKYKDEIHRRCHHYSRSCHHCHHRWWLTSDHKLTAAVSRTSQPQAKRILFAKNSGPYKSFAYNGIVTSEMFINILRRSTGLTDKEMVMLKLDEVKWKIWQDWFVKCIFQYMGKSKYFKKIKGFVILLSQHSDSDSQ